MDSSPEIYVGNFPTSFSTEDLLSLFQDFKDIRIRSFKKEEQKCFAFLQCRNERQVIDVVTTMHDIDVCKRNLIVRAKDRDLQKRIDESLLLDDGLTEQTQTNSSPNAKNDSAIIEKKNSMSTSVDEIVETFPSAVRFKNPRLQPTFQENVRSPATDGPRWKILSQFTSQAAKARDEMVNYSHKSEIKQNPNNGNNTTFNASNLQSLQNKSGDNNHQIPCPPKATQHFSVTNAANLGSVVPENNSSQSQELASAQSATRPQMGQQNFANRGRGHRNSNRGNRKNVPCNSSNMQSPLNNDIKYQSPGDYSAIAQHFKSTLIVSPSQPNVGCSRNVPEQNNASQYQVHANRNSDTKTPMRQQNRRNMQNIPLNNSRSQKRFINGDLESNIVQDLSVLTQDNFSVTNLPTTETLFETVPKRLYNSELKSPDSRDMKSYQGDISETNSPCNELPQHNGFRRRALLPTPTSKATPKSLFERGHSVLQKQQISNHDSKLRRKSRESAENCSRASSSLGSYDGEELLKEKLYYISVANFPFGTTTKDLFYLFEDFEPYNCVMICNIPLKDRKPTEAILGFKSEDQVTNAILNIDNTDYKGRIIIVTDAVDLSILPSLMKVSPKRKFKREQCA